MKTRIAILFNYYIRYIEEKISRPVLTTLILFALAINISVGQSVSVGKAGPEGKVLRKYIEPSELKTLVDNPLDSIWIIDVRSEKAYQNGHIPSAKSFPSGTIMNRLYEIPKDQYLILYCNVGAMARIVSKKLKRVGYRRYMVWGGISRWELEKENTFNSKRNK